MTFKAKVQGIIDTITLPYYEGKFIYKTKIMPLYRPHHKCTFNYWLDNTVREGWYITDKKGEMIPWVHFKEKSIICLYPSMITKIED